MKERFVSVKHPMDTTTVVPQIIYKSISFLHQITNTKFAVNGKCSSVSTNLVDQGIVQSVKDSSLVGILPLLTSLLLSNGPIRSSKPVTTISSSNLIVSLLSLKILNNIAVMNLPYFQSCLGEQYQQELFHILNFLLSYCLTNADSNVNICLQETPGIDGFSDMVGYSSLISSLASPNSARNSLLNPSGSNNVQQSMMMLNNDKFISKMILNEIILLLGYFSLQNAKNQEILQWGKTSFLQRLCGLPISYFTDAK